MLDFDFLADLPAPHEDEPPSLRSDIVDELADHLQCSLRRELLAGRDERTAEKRVLDWFGDPKKLARRLWWQAMWSRIMGQRVVSAVQWVLTLAAVVLAGAVFWQQATLINEIRIAREEDLAQRQAMNLLLSQIHNSPRSQSAISQPMVPLANQALPMTQEASQFVWSRLGLRLGSLPLEEQKSQLSKTKYRGGMRVDDVRDNSPASSAKIQKGDIFVGLHIWETTNNDNIIWIVHRLQTDASAIQNPVKFFVVRAQETKFGSLELNTSSI